MDQMGTPGGGTRPTRGRFCGACRPGSLGTYGFLTPPYGLPYGLELKNNPRLCTSLRVYASNTPQEVCVSQPKDDLQGAFPKGLDGRWQMADRTCPISHIPSPLPREGVPSARGIGWVSAGGFALFS